MRTPCCGKNARVSSPSFTSSASVRFALAAAAAFVVPATVLGACVPTGSAPPYDAGPAPTQASTFRESIGIMTTPFEDTFDRADAETSDGLPVDADSGPTLSVEAALRRHRGKLEDAGADALLALGPDVAAPEPATPTRTRSLLGPDWISTSKTGAWRVENGRLCGEGARNKGVWLNRTLPVNARIEFDAYAMSDEGDLKAEVWGDGRSYATSTSYTNATSYLAILGGWKNSIHALARLNEHGTDRKEIRVDKTSDDARERPVVRGQLYQFKIERTDGKTVRWSVNGVDYLSFADPAPLAGQGHDHFGFNEWEAKVCFDNVKVTPL